MHSFVCSGCTREIEINDEGETEQARIPLVVQTTICDFNNVSANGKPSTRIPMENGLETLFNTGDAIGIFAIKNGAIANAISNVKLTYKKQVLLWEIGIHLLVLRFIGLLG